jgi:DNA-binding Xre family transcriptional regulator
MDAAEFVAVTDVVAPTTDPTTGATNADYTDSLLPLMQRVGIESFRQLAKVANISRWQVSLLKRGQLSQMRFGVLVQLAQVLQVELGELLGACGVAVQPSGTESILQRESVLQTESALQKEYERLQGEMRRQADELKVQFQSDALRVLESWLTSWPTAAHMATQKETMLAKQLLPLVKPIERLLEQWGVVALAKVGAQVPYDPQTQDLTGGVANAGELVSVRYTGYRHGDKLILRSKVGIVHRPPFPSSSPDQ